MQSNDSSNSVDIMLGNPKKALISMSIPLIISLIITSFYNLIDAAWVFCWCNRWRENWRHRK